MCVKCRDVCKECGCAETVWFVLSVWVCLKCVGVCKVCRCVQSVRVCVFVKCVCVGEFCV